MKYTNFGKFGTVLCILLLAVRIEGHAAEISTSDGFPCQVTLEGEIILGDLEKLQKIVIPPNRICLNSPGGNFEEGLRIAKYIEGRGFSTVVMDRSQCLSVCAIVFMAGSNFEEIYLPRRFMHKNAVLGFHAPYVLPTSSIYTKENIVEAYNRGLSSVADMMELGASRPGEDGFIPNYIILEMLKMKPDQLFLVDNPIKADDLGVEVFGVNLKWDVKAACNACVNVNDGFATKNACNAPATVSERGGGVEYVFNGFAAEGHAACSVLIRYDANKAFISSYVEVGSKPDITEYKLLRLVDGLPPKNSLGIHR